MAGHLAALAAMQLGLWLLARLLKRPLTAAVIAAGLLLPHAVLAPWILSDALLLPTVHVQRVFPGSPRVEADERHARLNDSIYQFVPWETEVRRSLAKHRLPLWSDRIDGGSSPWSNPQAEVLSPVKMLARLVPVEDSVLTALALKMLVALQGTWLAARLLGASGSAALLAGGSFALGGGIVAWALFPHTSTVAWAPWLLASVLRLVRRPRWSFIVSTSILTAVVAFSGHPEIAVASGLLAALCGIWLSSRRAGRLRGVAAAALAAALGLGLAAPHVLPFVHVMKQARRVDSTKAHPPPKADVEWNRPRTWCVGEQGKLVLQPANPRALGAPFSDPPPNPVQWPVPGSVYAGLVMFAGAMAALASRRRYILPLVVYAAVGMALSMQFVFVERALRALPWVRYLVVNRVLPVVTLCLCLVAAVGLTQLLRRRPAGKPWMALLAAAVVSLAIDRAGVVIILWVLILAGVAVARWRARPAAAILIVVMLLDLVPWARQMLPVGRRDLFYPATAATEEMKRRTTEDGPWRVVGEGTAYYPATLAMHGIEDIRFHNPLAPQAYARLLGEVFGFHARHQYFSSFRVQDHPLLDFLNVRVVAVATGRPVPVGLQRGSIPGNGAMRIANNPGAVRRFFLAPAITAVPEGEVTEAVVGLEDPRTPVVAAQEVAQWRPLPHDWGPKAVRVVDYQPGGVLLRLPRRGDKLLATSLTFPEGWKATSGGERLRTLTINGAFLGVVVPERLETVRLRYVPPGLHLGLLLLVMSLTVLWMPLAEPVRQRLLIANRRGVADKIGQ